MQEYWASFWTHVDDLRYTLLRSFLIIGVGFVCLLIFYQPILQFLSAYPAKDAEGSLIKQPVQRIQILNQTSQDQIFELPANSWLISNLTPEKKEGSFYRLSPRQVLLYEEAIHSSLLIMGPIDGLVLVFKMCFWLSIALTAPFWGWNWLQFILPGLKKQERALLIPFLLCSLLFLGIGIAFAYYLTLPVANKYLILFNNSIGQNAWTLNHYVNYILLLCLGHAVAAELALLLIVLVHFRFLSSTWLIAKRRYMIVLAFIIGALLTPPDVLTQFLLALPLIGFYEIAILYAKWLNRSTHENLNLQ